MREAAELAILTWNIWTNGPATAHRIKAVSDYIGELSPLPDVVGLQEVTPWSLDLLSQSDWFDQYACNKDTTEIHSSPKEEHFLLLLLKKSTFTAIGDFVFRGYPNTLDGRGVLAVPAKAHGSRCCFAVTHLESPGGQGEGQQDIRRFCADCREMQAAQTWQLLGRGSREVFMFGDMNWLDDFQGLCKLPAGWCDPWMLLKPQNDPGYTYDCQTNRMMGPRTAQYRYRSRLDRLWCRLTEWKPLRVEVVGHERIPGKARLDVKGYDGRHLPILPSDHYAVYAQFQLCSAAES